VHFEQGVLGLDVRSFHTAKIGDDRSGRLWRLRHNTAQNSIFGQAFELG
jgi:hypothetical protein